MFRVNEVSWGVGEPCPSRRYCSLIFDDKLAPEEDEIEKTSILSILENSPQHGRNNDDIQAVSIKNRLVKHIPALEASMLKNLVALELKKCGICTIVKDDLKELTHLKDLWLHDNSIKQLPHDLFKYTRKLEIVSFRNNKIEDIGSRLLSPLKNLQFVDFRGNNVINSHFVSQAEANSIIRKLFEDTGGYAATNCLKLFESGRYSDFTIKVGCVEFKVHKNILGISSPVFSAMFDHQMQEKQTNELIIPDLSADAIKEFLEFIYTGNPPESSLNAMDLYKAAEKYQIERLPSIAESLILDEVTTENAVDVHSLGFLYDNEPLQSAAIKALSSMFPNVILPKKMSTEELKELIETKVKTDEAIQAAHAMMRMVHDKIFEKNQDA